jgi:hypothetical protein
VNARFSEYVTSGAFSMTLTRTQISSLALLAANAGGPFGGSLERKGLAEPIASAIADDRVEWRITGAGVLVMAMLFEAGLTNTGKDAAAAEVDQLNNALSAANSTVLDVRKKTWSMHAKLEAAEIEIVNLRREVARLESEIAFPGVKLKAEFAGREPARFEPVLRARDPFPDTPAAELLDAIDDAPQNSQPERTNP